jgi:YjbE family integral membrane protein
MDPAQFVSALLAIIVIDLVLAGDNAIVIALAARSLPVHLQRRAVLWGAIGAIGVRSVMTLLVVWLLQIPGLLLAGGAMLLVIAYRLLLADPAHDAANAPATTTFWAALRTIVVADAVMGLDNVLAVAGAAHGSYVLVVTGLAISVPIVVWGSRLVLAWVDRFPWLVYLGAGVLVWTAVKMITGEPLLRPVLEAAPAMGWAAYLAIPAVLWLGFVRNHRHLESRVHARLVEFARQRPRHDGATADDAAVAASATASATATTSAPALASSGESTMLKVLVPVDGSPAGLAAVRHAVAEYRRHHDLEVHLLNVQPRLYRHIGRFVSRRDREGWQHDRADAAMAGARAELAKAEVPHATHWVAGERPTEICRAAERLGVHHIVMGAGRKNSLTRMLDDSVTDRVLEATPVPVEVVPSRSVAGWERWGLRAGALLGAGSLVLLAID